MRKLFPGKDFGVSEGGCVDRLFLPGFSKYFWGSGNDATQEGISRAPDVPSRGGAPGPMIGPVEARSVSSYGRQSWSRRRSSLPRLAARFHLGQVKFTLLNVAAREAIFYKTKPETEATPAASHED